MLLFNRFHTLIFRNLVYYSVAMQRSYTKHDILASSNSMIPPGLCIDHGFRRFDTPSSGAAFCRTPDVCDIIDDGCPPPQWAHRRGVPYSIVSGRSQSPTDDLTSLETWHCDRQAVGADGADASPMSGLPEAKRGCKLRLSSRRLLTASLAPNKRA